MACNGMCDSCGKDISTTSNPTGPALHSCSDAGCQKGVKTLTRSICGGRTCPSNNDVKHAVEEMGSVLALKVEMFVEGHPEIMELIKTLPMCTYRRVTRMGNECGPEIPCSTLLLFTLTAMNECV